MSAKAEPIHIVDCQKHVLTVLNRMPTTDLRLRFGDITLRRQRYRIFHFEVSFYLRKDNWLIDSESPANEQFNRTSEECHL